jgi:hypothetical protein
LHVYPAHFRHGISPGCLIHAPVNAAMTGTGLNFTGLFILCSAAVQTNKTGTGDADQLTPVPGRL